jgi:hypothetical protein
LNRRQHHAATSQRYVARTTTVIPLTTVTAFTAT